MELRGRLGLIAQKVPRCGIVSDIGTDHAYIPVYLAEHDICDKAIAADVNEGPLILAKKNIERYGLEDIIETRLCDGMEGIEGDETEVVVIAGMGGTLISEILSKSIDKAKKSGLLVLQPMNSIEELREWLCKNEFEITDEELTNEGEKIYNIICTKWTGQKQCYTLADLYVGKKLIDKRDPLLFKMVDRLIRNTDKVLTGLRNTTRADEAEYNKALELKNELERVKDNIK